MPAGVGELAADLARHEAPGEDLDYVAHAMVAVAVELGARMAEREPPDVEGATRFATALFVRRGVIPSAAARGVAASAAAASASAASVAVTAGGRRSAVGRTISMVRAGLPVMGRTAMSSRRAEHSASAGSNATPSSAAISDWTVR